MRKAGSVGRFGKFEILATYSYAKALLQGMEEEEAKRYGFAIAVLGAQAKRGIVRKGGKSAKGGGGKANADALVKAAAEKKKKSSISAADFDKMAKRIPYFPEFRSHMLALVKKGFSYEEVKELAAIPPVWGAKIDWNHWVAHVKPVLE